MNQKKETNQFNIIIVTEKRKTKRKVKRREENKEY